MINLTQHTLPHGSISYYEHVAQDCMYHSDQWFRYLRKIITPCGNTLTQDEINTLLVSDKLGIYQKITLKQASIPGTPTNLYVLSLNQKSTTPILNAIRKKLQQEGAL